MSAALISQIIIDVKKIWPSIAHDEPKFMSKARNICVEISIRKITEISPRPFSELDLYAHNAAQSLSMAQLNNLVVRLVLNASGVIVLGVQSVAKIADILLVAIGKRH